MIYHPLLAVKSYWKGRVRALATFVDLHRPQIVFDRYHMVAKANEAVDTVCRIEDKTRPELKASGYAWLKNEASLITRQRECLALLIKLRLQFRGQVSSQWHGLHWLCSFVRTYIWQEKVLDK